MSENLPVVRIGDGASAQVIGGQVSQAIAQGHRVLVSAAAYRRPGIAQAVKDAMEADGLPQLPGAWEFAADAAQALEDYDVDDLFAAPLPAQAPASPPGTVRPPVAAPPRPQVPTPAPAPPQPQVTTAAAPPPPTFDPPAVVPAAALPPSHATLLDDLGANDAVPESALPPSRAGAGDEALAILAELDLIETGG